MLSPATFRQASLATCMALAAVACSSSASPSTATPTTGTDEETVATVEEATDEGPAVTIDDGDDGEAAYTNPELPVAERVEDLLARMTLEEKVGQMTLLENNSIEPDDVSRLMLGGVLSGGDGAPTPNTPDAWAAMVDEFQAQALTTRLGIPIIYGADAVHGHGLLQGATVFPHNIGLGASGDADLVEQIGRATAIEVAATGVDWNFSPVLAVVDDIRWGRTYESYGADANLVADLGAAYVRGLQGDSLADDGSVLATAKHWIGDGSAVWGTSTTDDYQIDQGVSPGDDALLDELVGPYEAAFDDGAIATMASFSSWGPDKVHGSAFLLDAVLRDEVGFNGFVVSDWAGVDQVSDDYADAVVQSTMAGIDMNMVPTDGELFADDVLAAVESGDITQDRIDEAVRRILTTKFELGLFEQPFAATDLATEIASDAHRQLARSAVSQSTVLLQNDGALPLTAAEGPIFVGGPASDDVGRQSGGWTLGWQGSADNDVEGVSLTDALIAEFGDENVFQDDGGLFTTLTDETPSMCIVAVGEAPYSEGLGDSATLEWEGSEAVDEMSAVCPALVVVIISGRPVIVTDDLPNWNAVVAAWLPGSEAGGIVDVLTGATPFSATLPVAWPGTIDDLPLEPDDETALFPAGFGLTLEN